MTGPRWRAHLEEGRVVVLDAQLAAHGAHVVRRAPQLVPRQVRVQVVPARPPIQQCTSVSLKMSPSPSSLDARLYLA